MIEHELRNLIRDTERVLRQQLRQVQTVRKTLAVATLTEQERQRVAALLPALERAETLLADAVATLPAKQQVAHGDAEELRGSLRQMIDLARTTEHLCESSIQPLIHLFRNRV